MGAGLRRHRGRGDTETALSPSEGGLSNLRRGWLVLTFRGQENNRARQWDGEKLNGEATLVIAMRPRGGYVCPDFPGCRLLHMVADVVRRYVAVIHDALSLPLSCIDLPTGGGCVNG